MLVNPDMVKERITLNPYYGNDVTSQVYLALQNALIYEGVKDPKKTMSSSDLTGEVEPDFYDFISSLVTEHKLELVWSENWHPARLDYIKREEKDLSSSFPVSRVYKGEDCAVFVSVWLVGDDEEDSRFSFSLHIIEMPSRGMGLALARYLKDKELKTDRRAYTITGGPANGYRLTDLGTAALPLEIGNYTEETLDKFHDIVSDLTSDRPRGRLSIIEGPPGTGKTYLIRALLDEVQGCKFIVLPPHLVAHLGDPELVSFFIGERARSGKKPMVLILEDADSCLTARAADNIATISALLNLTDGILGTLINFRIVATTNAKKTDIDPALLRDGRLSAYINIDDLVPDHAAEVYMRLTDSKDKIAAFKATSKCKTLAEVYSITAGKIKEVSPQKEKRRPAGFRMDE